jgi:hypothetical protein
MKLKVLFLFCGGIMVVGVATFAGRIIPSTFAGILFVAGTVAASVACWIWAKRVSDWENKNARIIFNGGAGGAVAIVALMLSAIACLVAWRLFEQM